MDTATATEGLHAEEENDTQQQGQLHPANPAERNNSLEGVAVTNEAIRVFVADALRVADSVRERRRTAEPEDPGDQHKDTVARNRRENATDTRNKEGQLHGKPSVYVRKWRQREHSTSQ